MKDTSDPSARQTCEQAIARTAGRAHAMLAPRATTALIALLRALRLPPGSEVLMPATLCANPAQAVQLAGLQPIFADIHPETFLMDLQAAKRVLGPNTRVILPVPLFGLPLDVPDVLDFAQQHRLILIEDAAHAVGVRYANRQPAGSLGLCSMYSFGPGKIAAAGGGAALMSDDPDLLGRARTELSRIHLNTSDLDSVAPRIQTALDNLPQELEQRTQQALAYRSGFNDPKIQHPPATPLWKYSLLLPTRPERDALTRDLLARGIAATNLYPPLHLFFRQPRPASYPIATDVFSRIVNLPTLAY